MKRYMPLMLLLSAANGFIAVMAHGAMSHDQARDTENFVDGIMQRAVVMGETVGAVVALVHEGRLVMARGYGIADLQARVPVEAGINQFRIGGISKLLVWIAVLQQVEAGRLGLDADINRYLTDFKMSSDFTVPITLRHLMTHTAGLEDHLLDLYVSGPRQLGVLGEVLANNVPRRISPPGELATYSNYGAALAGHTVARVAGMNWDDYVDTHILGPLGMRHTSTRQPLPEDMRDTRAKGYVSDPVGAQEQAFMYMPMAPAGAASATGVDMAKLMIELLNPAGSRVLSAVSKSLLLGRAHVLHPHVNGMTLGLYEMSQGSVRAVGHNGSTVLFHSRIILWPEARTGLFVSTNTEGGETAVNALVQTLAERLGLVGERIVTEDVQQGGRYVGHYIGSRRNHSNYTKLLGLKNVVRVTHDSATNALVIKAGANLRSYRQVAEHVFQQIGGHSRLVFKEAGGQGQVMSFSDHPTVAYTRAETHQTPWFNLLVVAVWGVLAAGVLLIWPVSAITNRHYPWVPGQRLLSWMAFGASLIVAWFLFQLVSIVETTPFMMIRSLEVLLWYPVIFCILVGLQLLYALRVWIEGYWQLVRRLHFTLFLLVQSVMVWWFWYWNLLPETLLEYLK